LLPGITPAFVFQTGFPPGGIPTNYASGDFVLFTGLQFGQFPSPGNPGPITITFDEPVSGAGSQLTVDDTFEFTAFISALDVNNNLLGTFSTRGTSSVALDELRRRYLYQRSVGQLLEGTVTLLLASPLLAIAGFYDPPFQVRAEAKAMG
jgi:hypothetical protein